MLSRFEKLQRPARGLNSYVPRFSRAVVYPHLLCECPYCCCGGAGGWNESQRCLDWTWTVWQRRNRVDLSKARTNPGVKFNGWNTQSSNKDSNDFGPGFRDWGNGWEKTVVSGFQGRRSWLPVTSLVDTGRHSHPGDQRDLVGGGGPAEGGGDSGWQGGRAGKGMIGPCLHPYTYIHVNSSTCPPT